MNFNQAILFEKEFTKHFDKAWSLRREDTKEALRLALKFEVELLEKDVPSSLWLARCQLLVGNCLWRNGQIVEAFKQLSMALPMLEAVDQPKWISEAYSTMAVIHDDLGNRLEALIYYEKLLTNAQSMNDEKLLYTALYDFGHFFLEKSDYQTAISYFSRAKEYIFKGNDIWERVTVLGKIGICLIGLKEFKEAKPFLEHGFKLSVNQNHSQGQMIANLNFAKFYKAQDLFEPAHQFYNRAIEFAQQSGAITVLISALWNVGQIKIKQNIFHAAEQALLEAWHLSEQKQLKQLQCKISKDLAEVYRLMEQYELAFDYLNDFHELKMEMFNEQSDKRLQVLEVQHQTEWVRQKAEKLQNENDILEIDLFKRAKQLEQLLTREQELTAELNQALEKEMTVSKLRSRIITTVSHEFRTPLTVINSSAAMLYKFNHKMSDQKREQVYQRIKTSIFELDELFERTQLVNNMESRQLSTNILPKTLSIFHDHLISYLQNKFPHASNLTIEKSAKELISFQTDENLLLEIIAILVDNALKYSPQRAPIHLSSNVKASQILFIVEDNGKGIPPEDTENVFDLFYRGQNVIDQRGMGVGLYLARQYAKLIDATVKLVPKGLNNGVKAIVQLPQTATPTQ